MKNEQTNNLIVGAVAFVLIIGGVVYYRKNKAPAEVIIPIPLEEEKVVLTPEPESTKEELLKQKVTKANAEELKAQETVKKAQWNNAMSNARTAFGKGDYDKAIVFYNEALSYFKTDTAYSGLFVVYSAQNNIDQARIALDSAIKLNPRFTEYWNSKLILLDYHTNLSFTDLTKVYNEALAKVDPATKINLVTIFARIAENNKEYKDAISLWEYAKNMYPDNTVIYQGEIDRLQKFP